MSMLFVGLLLFLSAHSVRIVAEGWRSHMIGRIGPGAWRGLVSAVSLVGLVLIVMGYAAARQSPTELWPVWRGARHLAALLSLIAFVLLAASFVPGNAIKRRLRHPMVLGVKVWALAHLLANGTLADAVLFGAFLIWAVFDFRSARRRDAGASASAVAPGIGAQGGAHPASRWADLLVLCAGCLAWGVFAFALHARLIGVSPLG